MRYLTIFFALVFSNVSAQLSKEEIETKRAEHIQELSDLSKGILNAEEIEHLGEITYFDYDPNFVIEGKFTKDIGKKFKMPTSSERTPIYRRYGFIDFIIDKDSFHLEVYQNIELIKQKQYKNYLFIPFKDLTASHSTYGGGRYIDFKIPESEIVIIDFNTAYNPYCAYSYRYSCPIPPAANHLKVEINAGEKTPTGH